MSHVTSVDVVITSLEALKLAAADCGLEFREGQKTMRWYGRWVGDYQLAPGVKVEDLGKCDHALSVPNDGRAYEVGVCQVGDHYELRWDFWNGGFGLQQRIGENGANLCQRYAYHQARMAAVDQGWDVEEETLADGTIKLTCSTPEFQTVGAW